MPAITTLKTYAKRIPLLAPAYRALRSLTARAPEPGYVFSRQQLPDDTGADRARILNILNYTKTSGSSYSAKDHPAGYHEITIGSETFSGQRSPHARLQHVPLDFNGKTLLDIGCNQGGMVFALHDKIGWGVGLDFDYRMVNACNLIRTAKQIENCSFYVFDIDRDPHDLVLDLLPQKRVDVVFFLAVAMWVEKWREIILFSAGISNLMVFETNGSDVQQEEQIAFLRQTYREVTILAKASEDDAGQKMRQLVIARNPH